LSLTTPDGNTLTITGYDAATGTVTYTYTLVQDQDHAAADGTNDHFETFEVSLTDMDGDETTADLVVRVIDDVPTAHDDADTVLSGQYTAGGNVITGVGTTGGDEGAGVDVKGADGATVTAVSSNNETDHTATDNGTTLTIEGQYGTLVLTKATGEYV